MSDTTTTRTKQTADRVADTATQAANQGAQAMNQAANQGAQAMNQAATQGAEQFRAGTERMAAAGNEAFQQTVDRSLGALNELNAAYKHNLEAMVASMTAATRGAEALSAQAMEWSKKSMEDGMGAARQMSSARSVQEVVELQTSFARSATEAYMAELNRWSDTVRSTFNDAAKPINERVTAAVEQAQSQR